MNRFIVFLLFVLVSGDVHSWEDLANVNLDTYLHEHNALITEGYVTPQQKAEFIRDLRDPSKIKKILEIGFNAGHSSELFLSATDCEKLVSFDINIHPYVSVGAEFIKKKFGDRFTLISGDSRKQVPQYAASHNNETFDLIFIDGGHSFNCCLSDILNCRQLAHKDTLLWIDDYVAEVKAAVDNCVEKGWIELLTCKETIDSTGGYRIWVTAHYCNSL